jgi:nicotinamide-nucleotide amidase
MTERRSTKAAIIAIGSELLRPGRRDTNADWLIARLLDLGIETAWRAAVEDDVQKIVRKIDDALAEARVVVLTGGLGPTDDDRTRDALASALQAPLVRDPAMAAHIDSLFTARGRTPTARQAVQADRPEGTEWIPNPLGSAPGILSLKDGTVLAALPGVPAEMRAMFDAGVAPALEDVPRASIARRALSIGGRPESWVDDTVRDLYAADGVTTTILASSGTVELLLTATGRDDAEARARLATVEAEMRARLGDDLFGADGETLAFAVGARLRRHGRTVATAESCTGGMLGAAITAVPGSSAWYLGGVVTYADALKTSFASVPPELIAEHGAVSEPVARALAAGIRTSTGASYGIGITGIAGPDGGTAQKPVGLVFIAIDDGGPGVLRRLDWPGDRELIRRRATAAALDMLRRLLAP